MKFVSADGEVKRVAHTSGVMELIGKEPVRLAVDTFPGLQACAMAAGCIPYVGTETAVTSAPPGPEEEPAAPEASAEPAAPEAPAAPAAPEAPAAKGKVIKP